MSVAMNNVQRIIALSRKLEQLQSHKALLDAQIAQTVSEIAQFAAANGAPPAGVRTGTDRFQIELLAMQRRVSKADQALDILRQNPTIAYSDLAKLLYGGDDESAKNRTRSIIHFLVNKAKIRKRDDDRGWEVLPDTAARVSPGS